MIQINCTTDNVKSPAVLLVSNGDSVTAFVESNTRSIFRLPDTDGKFVGQFRDSTGNILFDGYIIPTLPGAYEGPLLSGVNNVPVLNIIQDIFVDENGNNYNWHGHIDFMLYKRSLDGIQIEPILEQRYAAGSRAVAFLMQASFIERFFPTDYGQRYYDHIPDFLNALKVAGFLAMPIVYADEQVINSGMNFVYKLAELFNNKNWVFPSLGNEYPKNGFDPSKFTKPRGTNFWSRGSALSDMAPYYPSWDWKEWHPRRDWPKVLFGNDDAWYVKQGTDGNLTQIDSAGMRPCIVTEPIGFWNQNVPNRRSNDPNLAKVVGGTSIYFARGANFMSEEGLRCEPWDDVTYDCAVKFFNAINQS